MAMLANLVATNARAEDVVEQWVKRYAGPSDFPDEAYAIAVDSAGNVIVTGRSFSGGGSTSDYYTAKYAAANGALLWEKRYNGPGDNVDEAHAVVVDHEDNVIVTGFSSGSGSSYDYYTAKYAAADGSLLWERRYNGPANKADAGSAMALDGMGNVIVTGYSYSASNTPDYYTAKYAAGNGALVWEKRYNGPSNSTDIANAVAVDSAGDVIVTGQSFDSVNSYDYYTAKYAAADGSLVWEKRYNGLGNYLDWALAVAVDAAGNAIVTGQSSGPGQSTTEYYTVKYSATNGAVMWDNRYLGPGNRGSGNAIVVDSAGNVLVTGGSVGNNGRSDYYTAKYRGADGSLMWEKRYHGPDDSDDAASAMALDSVGNVLVTGHSGGIYATVKYASADGSLLWEKRYAGIGFGDETPNAVTADIFGNAIVTGSSRAADGGSQEYATVKYAPAFDADNDGLLDPWELGHFGTTAGHSALDDADHDGLVELVEMAFGTDPLVPDAIPTPAVIVEDEYLTVTIMKQPGVAYEVQTAATVNASAFSASTTTVITNTATTLKVRDNVRITEGGSRFLRAKIISGH